MLLPLCFSTRLLCAYSEGLGEALDSRNQTCTGLICGLGILGNGFVLKCNGDLACLTLGLDGMCVVDHVRICMIGTLGTKIVFEVSAEQVLTFESLSREVAGRWAAHEILGAKPKTEYLGPAAQTASLTIRLSAALGVKPRTMLETVEEMVESGDAEYLIIGGKMIGRNRFYIESASESWDRIYSRGELAAASVTLNLGEYS